MQSIASRMTQLHHTVLSTFVPAQYRSMKQGKAIRSSVLREDKIFKLKEVFLMFTPIQVPELEQWLASGCLRQSCDRYFLNGSSPYWPRQSTGQQSPGWTNRAHTNCRISCSRGLMDAAMANAIGSSRGNVFLCSISMSQHGEGPFEKRPGSWIEILRMQNQRKQRCNLGIGRQKGTNEELGGSDTSCFCHDLARLIHLLSD